MNLDHLSCPICKKPPLAFYKVLLRPLSGKRHGANSQMYTTRCNRCKLFLEINMFYALGPIIGFFFAVVAYYPVIDVFFYPDFLLFISPFKQVLLFLCILICFLTIYFSFLTLFKVKLYIREND